MSRPLITNEPHVFARQWYRPEEIHVALQWTSPAFGKRMGNTIPEDVRSREFAEWLAGQYAAAMAKGAELAVREMAASHVRCCPECGHDMTEMGTTKVYWLCDLCGHYIEPMATKESQVE